MSRKIWNIRSYDKNAASVLARKCGIDDFAVLLLQSRGITRAEEVIDFISAAENELSSPYLLKDMERAAERIRLALENAEKIHVFGDYDADGVTATALLVSYLETVGADVSYSIPSRLKDGYGLSPETAVRIAENGARLVITVDNGIASFEEAEIFKSRGIDFIVTDHHKVGASLPDAYAVIDPHRADDTSPEENLAGVGVALKLVAALEDGDYDSVFEDFGDLVTIGTVADIVPLTGENRIIVSKGLRCIDNTYRPGLRMIIERAGIRGDITASGVAFGIAPRINAAGRMDSAYTALSLLLTDDEDEAAELTEALMNANTDRQNKEAEISEDVERYLDAFPELRNDAVIVVHGENWHPGVIGIAASRLVEKYGRPAVVICVDEDGNARGSARSIDGYSLYDALSYSSEYLTQFGGHTLAAGFSVKKENIDLFRQKMNEYASILPPFYPSMDVDIRLNPAALSTDILESIALLEPYGAENPSPVFGLFGMTVTGVRSIGSDKHIRLSLSKGRDNVQTVFFGQTLSAFPYKSGDTVDVALKIERNEYKGEVKLSLQVKDIRPAGENDRAMFESMGLYRRFLRGERLSPEETCLLRPDRNLMGAVYKCIKENKKWSFSEEILCMRTGCPYEKAGAVKICLDALCEVGLLINKGTEYEISDFVGKADLRNCEKLEKLGFIF